MLYASEYEQAAFHSGRQKDLTLTFSDGTVITNDDIALENVSFEQSIMEGDQFEYGHVSSSCFKVRVLGVVQRFKGLNVHAEITAYGEDECGVEQSYTRSIGYFTVVSDKATSDRLYRDLECYDKLYEILSTDYSTWYNSLKFPMTLKAYRDAFFNYVGITQENISLINDNMTIERNFVADNYSGSDLLRHICEINGVCGHINYEGKFRYVVFRIVLDGLFPRDDLYPSNTIYPRDPEYFWLRSDEYIQGSLTYEEYECHQVTQLQIRMSEGDVGVVTGSNGNTYIIQNNPLVYGMSDANLRRVANNALAYIRILHYTPCSMKCPANLWYELGDVVGVTTDKDAALLCVGTRRLTGITALFDEYSCEGEEYYSEKANSTNYNIQVLRQKSNELVRNVEETKSTITEVRTELNNSVTTLQSQITQTAEEIQSTVSKTQKEWDITGYTISVYGYSTPTSNSPMASSYNGKYYLNQTDGYIYKSNGSTWSYVKACATIQSSLQSQITQTANSINLEVAKKVNTGQVISQINLEVNDKVGTINIKSNQITIDSDNFHLNANGQITKCKYITATGGTIGGFTIGDTQLYTGTITSNSGGNIGLATYNGRFTRSINNVSRGNLQFALGSKFAIAYDGTMYSAGAVVNGTISSSGESNASAVLQNGKLILNTSNATANDSISIHSVGNQHPELSIGIDTIYFWKDSSHFVQCDWYDLIRVGYNYANIRDVCRQYGEWD